MESLSRVRLQNSEFTELITKFYSALENASESFLDQKISIRKHSACYIVTPSSLVIDENLCADFVEGVFFMSHSSVAWILKIVLGYDKQSGSALTHVESVIICRIMNSILNILMQHTDSSKRDYNLQIVDKITSNETLVLIPITLANGEKFLEIAISKKLFNCLKIVCAVNMAELQNNAMMHVSLSGNMKFGGVAQLKLGDTIKIGYSSDVNVNIASARVMQCTIGTMGDNFAIKVNRVLGL